MRREAGQKRTPSERELSPLTGAGQLRSWVPSQHHFCRVLFLHVGFTPRQACLLVAQRAPGLLAPSPPLSNQRKT